MDLFWDRLVWLLHEWGCCIHQGQFSLALSEFNYSSS
jgi:hypothetical protein